MDPTVDDLTDRARVGLAGGTGPDTPARRRRSQPRSVVRGVVKRTIDVVVAGLALVLLFPVFVLLAALIVLESPGPVFYRAERVGLRGRPLRMLKLRKMRRDATGGPLTVAHDERLTHVGAWMVGTKLDELPQLWHVLLGDMSLVGPRPESRSFVDRFPAEYEVIVSVRPGLTGYTQLAFARESAVLDPRDPQGHYVTALLPQKVALDRLYASGPGTRRDLKILVATVLTIVFRQPIAVNRVTGALTIRH